MYSRSFLDVWAGLTFSHFQVGWWGIRDRSKLDHVFKQCFLNKASTVKSLKNEDPSELLWKPKQIVFFFQFSRMTISQVVMAFPEFYSCWCTNICWGISTVFCHIPFPARSTFRGSYSLTYTNRIWKNPWIDSRQLSSINEFFFKTSFLYHLFSQTAHRHVFFSRPFRHSRHLIEMQYVVRRPKRPWAMKVLPGQR